MAYDPKYHAEYYQRNTALGLFDDDPDRLRAAASYLVD